MLKSLEDHLESNATSEDDSGSEREGMEYSASHVTTSDTNLHSTKSAGSAASRASLRGNSPKHILDQQRALLFTYVARCDVDTVRKLLNDGINPNIADDEGKTGISLAATQGDLSMLELLLEFGGNPNLLDQAGLTTLDAALESQLKTKQILEGATMAAAKLEKVIEKLESIGATKTITTNNANDSQSPSRNSTSSPSPDRAISPSPSTLSSSTLNANSNSITQTFKTGSLATTLVSPRTRASRPSGLTSLPENSADSTMPSTSAVNHNKYSSSSSSSSHNQANANVTSLSPLKNHPNSANSQSSYSTESGHKRSKFFKSMSTMGRNISRPDSFSLVPAFLQFAADGNLKEVSKLLEEGLVHANDSDKDKRTAAHFAAQEGQLEILKVLISHGCDINSRDRWGYTPYNDAVRAEKDEVIEYLVENGGGEETFQTLKNNSDEEMARLHARGIAERWAIEAEDLIMEPHAFARGAGGELFRSKWHGLPCVSKSCAKMSAPNMQQLAVDLANEISMMSTLRHPYLVMFLGACFQHRPPILVMEYCAGGTLEERIVRARRGDFYTIPLSTRHRYIQELIIGMCFLHNWDPPIVHRDLKPSNVLLSSDDHIKISDFGLSKFIPGKNKTYGDKFVMTGETGSYRFMAPEVFKHENYNEKVDVYSFSLIAYWLISGVRPFVGITDPIEAVRAAATEGARPVLVPIEGFPKARILLMRCWAQKPEERPSFKELIDRWAEVKSDFRRFGCLPV